MVNRSAQMECLSTFMRLIECNDSTAKISQFLSDDLVSHREFCQLLAIEDPDDRVDSRRASHCQIESFGIFTTPQDFHLIGRM